jgi:hypothetical protein
MKRYLLCFLLLGFSPLGYFLGFYLDGIGILGGNGFIVGAASMFILPWIVARLILKLAKPRRKMIASLLFVFALAAQECLIFAFVPPGDSLGMMGRAHRLQCEFPPDEMREWANILRKKHRSGTLAVSVGGQNNYYHISNAAVTVANSDIPAPLRGRFKCVFLQPNDSTGEEEVVFALDERTGIICDGRKRVKDSFVYSMGDGVHAYRYQRL